jgi:hypothetical protein
VPRTLATVLTLAVAAIAMAGPARADCNLLPELPRGPRDAAGTTFLGRLESVEFPTYHWRVRETYAGGLGTTATFTTEGCHGVRNLTPGTDYLFSTADMAEPLSKNSLAWRLVGAGRVELVGFDLPPREYPSAIRRAATLAEAVALVAPGSGVLPETDTRGREAHVTERGGVVGSSVESTLAVVAALAFLIAMKLLRARPSPAP